MHAAYLPIYRTTGLPNCLHLLTDLLAYLPSYLLATIVVNSRFLNSSYSRSYSCSISLCYYLYFGDGNGLVMAIQPRMKMRRRRWWRTATTTTMLMMAVVVMMTMTMGGGGGRGRVVEAMMAVVMMMVKMVFMND